MNINVNIYKENKFFCETIIDIGLDFITFKNENLLDIEQEFLIELKNISKQYKKEIFSYYNVREVDWENLAPIGASMIAKTIKTKNGYSCFPKKDTLISFAAYDIVWCNPVLWEKYRNIN